MVKEKVLLLSNIEQFYVLRDGNVADLISTYSTKIKNVVTELIGEKFNEYERIYFGNEFCEYLLPTVEQVEEVMAYCKKQNKLFSVVTPYISESSLKKIDKLLDYLDEKNEDIEVVCNDWGVCSIIHEKYSNLKAVIGRLLDKMSKDARLSKEDYDRIFDENSIEYLKSSNTYVDSYIDILREYGVERIEYDCPPQGLNINTKVKDIYASAYMPFGYITTGRMCMMKFLSQDGNEKYSLEKGCVRNCQKYDQVMRKIRNCVYGDNAECGIKNIELYRKGNTIFYLSENYDEIISNNELIDRVIFQPTIPM